MRRSPKSDTSEATNMPSLSASTDGTREKQDKQNTFMLRSNNIEYVVFT